jgi:hypothetical protein
MEGNGGKFDRKTKKPVQKDGPEIADSGAVQPVTCDKIPGPSGHGDDAHGGLRYEPCLNLTGERFVVNIEMGAVCEYFHNAWRERSLGALI